MVENQGVSENYKLKGGSAEPHVVFPEQCGSSLPIVLSPAGGHDCSRLFGKIDRFF